MSNRLFIGIKCSKHIRSKADKWLDSHKQILNAHRKVPLENLHITLVPPNIISNIEDAKDKLEQIDSEEFELKFKLIETAPYPPFRLLWAKANETVKLAKLKNSIEDIFNYREKRSNNVHITLARFTDKPKTYFNKEIEWNVNVNELVLFESHLKSYGAEYEILHKKTL